MDKSLITGFFLAAIPWTAGAAQEPTEVYLSCGFDDGIPATFMRSDNDGCELHFTMTQLGFESRDSWITLREEGTENIYAASTSKHKSIKGEDPKPADDWLVTPEIWIKGSSATLSWKGMSVNESSSKASSYRVMVSTAGQRPEDFSGEPIAIIENEAIGSWTPHEIDLSAYEGQKIFLAFVNNSLSCEMLAIDDIRVEGLKGLAELVITPGDYYLGGEDVEIGGTVTPYTDTPVETISLVCTTPDGKEMTLDYENLGLKYGEVFTFSFPEKIHSSYGESVSFSVAAKINGVDFGVTERQTRVLAFKPSRKVVVEEVTGMWCGYCPEGIVAMETLQENYPDEFIGIAVHYQDALEAPGYPAAEVAFPGGAPSGWFDRKVYSTKPMINTLINGKYTYVTTMGGFETILLERLEELPEAEVQTAVAVADGKISVDSKVRFPFTHEEIDCRLAYILVEDHVRGDGFYQTNYHSGRNEIIGGFEELPDIIVDFEFNHVMRAVYGGYNGLEGVVPSSVKAGEEYTFAGSWDLPAADINLTNAKLVSVIIDGASGEILNGFSSPLISAGTDLLTASGTAPVISQSHDSLTASAEGEISLTLFDLAGNKVLSANGRDTVSLDTSSLHGMFIARASAGGKETTMKIALH